MSYLDDAAAWERFWSEHRDGAARAARAADVRGPRARPERPRGRDHGPSEPLPVLPGAARAATGWPAILRAEVTTRTGAQTVTEALWARGLQLRCEPGRSLVDGCGLTAARVEFRKQRGDGTWLIGLAMNRTQCRSTSDDFLVDPLLLRPCRPRRRPGPGAIEGYLVGAYCIERELLTWRRLSFPQRRRRRRHRRLPEHRGLPHAHPRERLAPDSAGPQPRG